MTNLELKKRLKAQEPAEKIETVIYYKPSFDGNTPTPEYDEQQLERDKKDPLKKVIEYQPRFTSV